MDNLWLKMEKIVSKGEIVRFELYFQQILEDKWYFSNVADYKKVVENSLGVKRISR